MSNSTVSQLLQQRCKYVQRRIDRLTEEVRELEQMEPSEARDRILAAARSSLAVALGEQKGGCG